MTLECYSRTKKGAVPISFIANRNYETWFAKQQKRTQSWLKVNDFRAHQGKFCLLPDVNGKLDQVVVGVTDWKDWWSSAGLAKILPLGSYYFDESIPADSLSDFAMAWGLGAYQFTRYKKPDRQLAKLVLTQKQEQQVAPIVEAIYKVRDLINTPTEDMSPADLALAAKSLADEYKADHKQWQGKSLMANFPAVHMVGRASTNEPRFIEFSWGNKHHPLLVLAGKGVCFDSGGLNLKNSHSMRYMKKDMGGSAHVLGLAQLIMQRQLPVRLRVLIPAVENVVSGNAYHPGDVIKTRHGLTVEVSDTDAEGRLILCDALSYACEQNPDLVIDFSTLTGAARVALGPDVAVMFCNDEQVSQQLVTCSQQTHDPLWRLPLYQPYRKMIDSPIADIDNSGNSPYGGAITAALFLQEFIKKGIPWVHFDVMAWNFTNRPGRPEGGEAMGLRAVFAFLQQRYN